MRAMGFGKQVDDVKAGKCPFCGSTKTKRENFKNELSYKDYTITGMCQACMDAFYKNDTSL